MFYRNCCGIEISQKDIKAVQIERRHKTWIIKNHATYDNPNNISFTDDLTAILEILHDIKTKFSCKRCVTAISREYMFYRNIELPVFNSRELKQALSWEAQEFTSVFDEEFVWDYEIVEKQQNSFKILMVGAPKKCAFDYVQLFESSGLELIALDVYPLATARFFSNVCRDKNIAIIHIDSRFCEITVLKRGKLNLARNIYLNKGELHNGYSWKDLIFEVTHLLANRRIGHDIDGIYLVGGHQNRKDFYETFIQYNDIPVLELQGLDKIFFDITKSIDYEKYINAIGFAMRR